VPPPTNENTNGASDAAPSPCRQRTATYLSSYEYALYARYIYYECIIDVCSTAVCIIGAVMDAGSWAGPKIRCCCCCNGRVFYTLLPTITYTLYLCPRDGSQTRSMVSGVASLSLRVDQFIKSRSTGYNVRHPSISVVFSCAAAVCVVSPLSYLVVVTTEFVSSSRGHSLR